MLIKLSFTPILEDKTCNFVRTSADTKNCSVPFFKIIVYFCIERYLVIDTMCILIKYCYRLSINEQTWLFITEYRETSFLINPLNPKILANTYPLLQPYPHPYHSSLLTELIFLFSWTPPHSYILCMFVFVLKSPFSYLLKVMSSLIGKDRKSNN